MIKIAIFSEKTCPKIVTLEFSFSFSWSLQAKYETIFTFLTRPIVPKGQNRHKNKKKLTNLTKLQFSETCR